MFKTVAFLSYNAIPEFKEGWHENEKMGTKMLVLPNSHNRKFMDEYDGDKGNLVVRNEVHFLLKKLHNTNNIDQIILYVGTFGHKVAIRLARKFPASKVTYVTCKCGLIEVKKLIKYVGHGESTLIVSECHGIKTMPHLCRNFLKTGEIKVTKKSRNKK